MPTARELLANRRSILVTGGAGLNCCAEAKGYGGAVVLRLLAESDAQVFNLDKMGNASDLSSIEALAQAAERHTHQLLPAGAPHARLITAVTGRPGHDRRYAIDPTRISSELGCQPGLTNEEGMATTVRW